MTRRKRRRRARLFRALEIAIGLAPLVLCAWLRYRAWRFT